MPIIHLHCQRPSHCLTFHSQECETPFYHTIKKPRKGQGGWEQPTAKGPRALGRINEGYLALGVLIWVRDFSCGFCSHGGEEVVLAKRKRRTEDSEGTEKKKERSLRGNSTSDVAEK